MENNRPCFHCQRCGRVISDSSKSALYWYQCLQDHFAKRILARAFLHHVHHCLNCVGFNERQEITTSTGDIPKRIKESLLRHIQPKITKDKPHIHEVHYIDCFFLIDTLKRLVWWSGEDIGNKFSDENYKRAKLLRHGNMDFRPFTFCFCIDCIEKPQWFFCPVCGSRQVKVAADPNPDTWAIRDQLTPEELRRYSEVLDMEVSYAGSGG